MKYRLLSIAVLVAAITFGGCIETQMLVTVNKDGSGTIRETVTMKKKVVESIREMTEQMKQSAEEGGVETEEQKPFELFSEDDIRGNAEKHGTNVRYVSHGLIDEDEVEGYSATYAFDDINTVKVNQNPGASMPDIPGSESTEDSGDELVLFSFTPGSPAKLVIRPPQMNEGDPDEAEETDTQETDQEEESEDGMEQMKEFFRDMRILVQIAVDGTITNTNASFVDGSVVTIMDVNFNSFLDDPELLKELEKIESQGPAAAKELFKRIPGIRVETEEEITVNFN